MGVPGYEFTIRVSEELLELQGATSPRRINAWAKESMGIVLRDHHANRIDKHFTRAARHRYGHKPRSRRYRKRKRKVYGSVTDLVASGETKQLVTTKRTVRIGGTYLGTARRSPGLNARLIMELPFPVSKDNKIGNVKIQDMINEITAVTPDEETQMAMQFGRLYAERIRRYGGGKMRTTYRRRARGG